ncbi:hypothetical protein Zmor_007892 [Zophobas morio]|uniref:Uncharacterized protein n=1 Tax=Zophobas morio TaxID=2755281 RepID=A0AA38ITJ7_9CUCU|nr:hypothetical protein Zmor_007892 [Zophobas morio]
MASFVYTTILLFLMLGLTIASPLDYLVENQVQTLLAPSRIKRAPVDGWQINEDRDKNGILISKNYVLKHNSNNFDASALFKERPGKEKVYRIGATFRF